MTLMEEKNVGIHSWNETAPMLASQGQFEDVDLSPEKQAKRTHTRLLKLLVGAGLISLLVHVLCTQSSVRFKKSTSHNEHSKRDTSAKVCNTEACKTYAKSIRANLAPNYASVDPCTDFSTYSCGGWRDTHEMRPDQATVSVGSIIGDTNRNLLHSIFESPYATNTTLAGLKRAADKANFGKMKMAYDACMNEDAIRAVGVQPVRNILREFETLYPRAAPASKAQGNEELTKTLVWLANNSVSGLIRNRRKADDKNPNSVIISLGSGEVQMSKQYYNKSAVVANYTKAIAEMTQVVLSGKPIYEAPIPGTMNTTLYDKAKAIAAFEKRLISMTPDPEDSSNVTYYYNIKTVGEVDKIVPEISILRYLKAFAPKEYPITPNRTLLVGDINFYKNLSEVIQSTPRETLHDYFQWRLLESWTSRLHKNFTAPLRRFSNSMSGRDANVVSERWRTCLSELDNGLGSMYSAVFVERAFSKKDKALGNSIITNIKTVFSERLKNADWMTEQVKERAAKKVVNIIQKVGYQTERPNVEDPESLRDFYADLNVTTSYFENGRNYFRFGGNISWHDLLRPVDRARWGMTAPTVNAYYSPSGNEIVFPAGIMQLPVFSSDLPEYISYGAFGAVAGHELTHGFDNHGSKYDEDGSFNEWWDNVTISKFETRTKCFVDQYSKFTLPGLDGETLHVNGKLTLGENIADAGGIASAYDAWKKRDMAKPDMILPGLEEFTKDQMFYISFSNWWCGKVRPQQAISYLYTDPHSPADKRITGTTANSVGFLKAFNCPSKKPTCELW